MANSPFTDLDEQLDESESNASTDEQSSRESEPDSEPATSTQSKHGTLPEWAETVALRSFYTTDGSWSAYEDARFSVTVAAREHGIKDIQKREIDDAVLRVVNEHKEELAAEVLSERGVDTEADE